MKSLLAITLLFAVTSALQVRDVSIFPKEGSDEPVFTLDEGRSENTAYLEFFYGSDSKDTDYELRFAFTVNEATETPEEKDDGIEGDPDFEVELNGQKFFTKATCDGSSVGIDGFWCEMEKIEDEVRVTVTLKDMRPDFDGTWLLRAWADKEGESEEEVQLGAKTFRTQPFLRCTEEIVQPQLEMDKDSCGVKVKNADVAGCPGLTYPAPSRANLVISPSNLYENFINVDGIRLNNQRIMSQKNFALYKTNFEDAYITYTTYTDKTKDIELTVSYVDVNQEQNEGELEPFQFEFNKGCHDFTEFCKTQNETDLPPVWSSNLPSFVHVTGLVCHMNFTRSSDNPCRDEILPEEEKVATLTFGCEEGCQIKWDVDDYEAENAKFKCQADSLEWIPDAEDPDKMKEWFTCECGVTKDGDGAASMASSIALITLAAMIALFRP